MHPSLFAGGSWTSYQIFKGGGGLTLPQFLEGAAGKGWGDFLKGGGGCNFLTKNKLKSGTFNAKKVYKQELFVLLWLRIQTGKI